MAGPVSDDRLLTVKDVCDRLSWGETAVRARVGRPGGIPAVRLSSRALRVRPRDLTRWIEQHVEGDEVG